MKKRPLVILFTALLFGSTTLKSTAQTVDIDRTKYPDYSERVNPDWSLMPQAQEAKAPAFSRTSGQRPDHVNNAETKHFPPVFN
jgi:hypothetical protein